MMVFLLLALLIVFFYVAWKPPGLRVLLYHNISENGKKDYLTLPLSDFEKQLQYIKKKGYTTLLLSELIHHSRNNSLPHKPLLITFDDGYKNNFTQAYPLLLKYGMKANIFLVAELINTDTYRPPALSEHLHVDDIRQMCPQTIEFGLHSKDHKNYNSLTIEEIDADLKHCREILESLSIPFQPCFAYTYGAYPKKDITKCTKLFQLFRKHQLKVAFRIGNRINKLPFKNKFLIQRIDIRGNDSFLMFKAALQMGKKVFFK